MEGHEIMHEYNNTLESNFGRIYLEKKKNLRNIVHLVFLGLCGPNLGTSAGNVKPRNQRSTFL